jgi:hypothetical protein
VIDLALPQIRIDQLLGEIIARLQGSHPLAPILDDGVDAAVTRR